MGPAQRDQDHLFAFSVAGISVGVRCEQAVTAIDFPAAYGPFRLADQDRNFDLELEANYGPLPLLDFSAANQVFDSGALWSLHDFDGRRVFRFASPLVNGETYRIAVMERNTARGTIHSLHPIDGISDAVRDTYFSPLEFPLAELLMVELLARNQGVLVHACGIELEGKGILFCGHSGAGKSTMSKLWQEAGYGNLLNDDRIVLRLQEDACLTFGTPWHGEIPAVSPRQVPLSAVFFLHHDESNSITEKSTPQASADLMARAFVPHWDRAGLGASLEVCTEIAMRTPCYDLAFRPDRDVAELVKCAL